MFAKQLSVKYHYYIWFILLLSLGIAFLPPSFFHSFHLLPASSLRENQVITSPLPRADQPGTPGNWMQDFAEAVYQPDFSAYFTILLGLWLAGIVAGIALFVVNQHQIVRLKRSFEIPPWDMISLFSQCRIQVGIQSHVPIFVSSLVKTPMTLGFRKPCVLIPKHLDRHLKKEKMRYILLHELTHIQQHDLIFNYGLYLLQILYWFNPFVWIAFQRIRLDREIYCDYKVLEMIGKSKYLDYGYALLGFAEHLSCPYLHIASNIAGPKEQLKKRLQCIANHQKDSGRLQRTSRYLALILILVAGMQLPVLAAFAQDQDQAIPRENILVNMEDLSPYFINQDACFVLYDRNKTQYTIFNERGSYTRVSPNSTYKIYVALNALEQGIISPRASQQSWNGQAYAYTAWNRDQNLRSAMQNSVNWYFQALEQQQEKQEIQSFLSRLAYGNQDVTGNLQSYWMESSLRISPLEQVKQLKDLYDNKKGFGLDNIKAVQEALLLEKNKGKSLYGKTGTGNINGQNQNGWFIGYVQSADNVYFFATYISGPQSSGSTAAAMTLLILQDKNIYSPDK